MGYEQRGELLKDWQKARNEVALDKIESLIKKLNVMKQLCER